MHSFCTTLWPPLTLIAPSGQWGRKPTECPAACPTLHCRSPSGPQCGWYHVNSIFVRSFDIGILYIWLNLQFLKVPYFLPSVPTSCRAQMETNYIRGNEAGTVAGKKGFPAWAAFENIQKQHVERVHVRVCVISESAGIHKRNTFRTTYLHIS